MKITLIQVFFAVLFTGGAFATELTAQDLLNRRVSLTAENETIRKVLADIEQQVPVKFAYRSQIIPLNKRISLEAVNQPLNEVLDRITIPNGISYEVVGQQIILHPTRKAIQASEQVLQPQTSITFPLERTVTGRVTDENGDILPGVNIILKGSQQGTVSNAEGIYEISVPNDAATLIFSFVGYVTQEVLIGNRSTLNIALQVDRKALEEVVVVGYGTQTKVNLTGAISQLSAESLKERPVTNITQALQGQIPNLNIVIGSGKPGTSGTLNIRGNTSITSTGEPLVLIDGVPSELDRINVNDVESVTVLKDASASAIYGARAAFGVILVTTKKGKNDKPVISYNTNFGWTTHATNTDFITSAYDNIRINEEAYYNALGRNYTGYTDEDYQEIYDRRNDKVEDPSRPWVMIKPDRSGRDVYKYYANFDWFNWFYTKWRPKQQHNLSITGSTDKINYYLSGSFNRETGIMNQNPDHFNRYNFVAKLDVNLTKQLTISSTTRFFRSNYTYYGKEDGFFPTVYNNVSTNHLYMTEPSKVPTNPDGTGTYLTDNGTYAIGYGAHLALMNRNLVGKDGMTDFTNTFEARYKIGNDFVLTGNYTYNFEFGSKMYRGVRLTYSLYPGVVEQVPRSEWDRDILKETTQNNNYHIFNLFGNYSKRIDDHNIQITAGYNREERRFKTVYAEGQELLSESLNDLNLITGERQVKGGASEWALSGLFYRVNYDYKGKYLFETSGRYDGTSRFKSGDRFGFFPSLSLGWRISEEDFFQPATKIFNDLKLRASYGSLGNQLVGTYAYIQSMPTTQMNYLIDGRRVTAVSSPQPVTPNLTWEKSVSKNIGIDAAFLNNRLNLTLDAYIRDTKGMLIKGKTLPKVFGATEPRENAGDLRTKGFEITLNWQDQIRFENSSIRYHIGVNLADYTAKITRFDNPTKIFSDYYVGKALGEIWGFAYDGYFKTDEEAANYGVNQDLVNVRRVQAPTADLKRLQAGDIKILDLNGNGRIDFGGGTVDDPGDRKIIGNSQPRYSFGIPFGLEWKGIELNVLLQGIVRQHYYPDLEAAMFWGPYARPYVSFMPTDFEEKIWRPENPNAYFPRMIGYIAQNSELRYENDMYLQNIGYMKLRNLSLGYRLPNKLIEKLRLSSANIYVSGENLITWTKFDTDYIDPEEVMWDKTGRTYPMGKTYSVGLNIKF